MRIESVDYGLFFIPLPKVLTDSTHGEMRNFSLVTAQVRDSDGAEDPEDQSEARPSNELTFRVVGANLVL